MKMKKFNDEMVLFSPGNRKELRIEDVEKLKLALGNKQTSTYLFTMILDSLEKKGKIESIHIREEEGEVIFDFEVV